MPRKKAIQQFFNAYTDHNVRAMLALCAESATFRYVPMGDAGEGLVREKAAPLWQSYMDAFPDFRTDVVAMMETTGGEVVCETLNGGTQANDVANIANKGGRLEVPHLFVFGFDENGLISKISAFWDNDTIYKQLGHTEPHG